MKGLECVWSVYTVIERCGGRHVCCLSSPANHRQCRPIAQHSEVNVNLECRRWPLGGNCTACRGVGSYWSQGQTRTVKTCLHKDDSVMNECCLHTWLPVSCIFFLFQAISRGPLTSDLSYLLLLILDFSHFFTHSWTLFFLFFLSRHQQTFMDRMNFQNILFSRCWCVDPSTTHKQTWGVTVVILALWGQRPHAFERGQLQLWIPVHFNSRH